MPNKIDWKATNRMVGARAKGHSKGDDFYETPPEATRALLEVEKFGGKIWEPAVGFGAISNVLTDYGYSVISTDLVDRGFGEGNIDFLQQNKLLAPNIITNPPYNKSLEFAETAISLGAQKVALLLRLVWLEGQKRRLFLENSPLKKVWVFSKRIPRMHRQGYDGKKSTSSIAFAWFIWDYNYNGFPEIGWINPKDAQKT